MWHFFLFYIRNAFPLVQSPLFALSLVCPNQSLSYQKHWSKLNHGWHTVGLSVGYKFATEASSNNCSTDDDDDCSWWELFYTVPDSPKEKFQRQSQLVIDHMLFTVNKQPASNHWREIKAKTSTRENQNLPWSPICSYPPTSYSRKNDTQYSDASIHWHKTDVAKSALSLSITSMKIPDDELISRWPHFFLGGGIQGKDFQLCFPDLFQSRICQPTITKIMTY